MRSLGSGALPRRSCYRDRARAARSDPSQRAAPGRGRRACLEQRGGRRARSGEAEQRQRDVGRGRARDVSRTSAVEGKAGGVMPRARGAPSTSRPGCAPRPCSRPATAAPAPLPGRDSRPGREVDPAAARARGGASRGWRSAPQGRAARSGPRARTRRPAGARASRATVARRRERSSRCSSACRGSARRRAPVVEMGVDVATRRRSTASAAEARGEGPPRRARSSSIRAAARRRRAPPPAGRDPRASVEHGAPRSRGPPHQVRPGWPRPSAAGAPAPRRRRAAARARTRPPRAPRRRAGRRA